MPRVDTAILAATIFLTCLMVNLHRYPVQVPAMWHSEPGPGRQNPQGKSSTPEELGAHPPRETGIKTFTFGPAPRAQSASASRSGTEPPTDSRQVGPPEDMKIADSRRPVTAGKNDMSILATEEPSQQRQEASRPFATGHLPPSPSGATSFSRGVDDPDQAGEGASSESSTPKASSTSAQYMPQTQSGKTSGPAVGNLRPPQSTVSKSTPASNPAPEEADRALRSDFPLARGEFSSSSAGGKNKPLEAQDLGNPRCDGSSGSCPLPAGKTERADHASGSTELSPDLSPKSHQALATGDKADQTGRAEISFTSAGSSLSRRPLDTRSNSTGTDGIPSGSSPQRSPTGVEIVPLVAVDDLAGGQPACATGRTEVFSATLAPEPRRDTSSNKLTGGGISPFSTTAERQLPGSTFVVGRRSEGLTSLRHVKRLPPVDGEPAPPSLPSKTGDRLPFYPSTGYE